MSFWYSRMKGFPIQPKSENYSCVYIFRYHKEEYLLCISHLSKLLRWKMKLNWKIYQEKWVITDLPKTKKLLLAIFWKGGKPNYRIYHGNPCTPSRDGGRSETGDRICVRKTFRSPSHPLHSIFCPRKLTQMGLLGSLVILVKQKKPERCSSLRLHCI